MWRRRVTGHPDPRKGVEGTAGETHHLYLSLSHLSKQLSIVKYCQSEKCNVRQVGQMGIGRGGGRGGNRITQSFGLLFRSTNAPVHFGECACPFWRMRQFILANILFDVTCKRSNAYYAIAHMN